MGKTVNTYNRIAWIYDPISRWLLGKHYTLSKFCYLDRVGRGKRVLILGGGTGENLREIVDRIGEQGSVYYVEASKSMIRMAKNRFQGKIPTNIKFVHSTDFSQFSHIQPDVILTQYFLDVLSDAELEELFEGLNETTATDTEWIFTDFYAVPKKRWLIKAMIRLFRIVVGHPRKDLPDYAYFFERWGLKEKEACSFMDGFIQAKVYKKA